VVSLFGRIAMLSTMPESKARPSYDRMKPRRMAGRCSPIDLTGTWLATRVGVAGDECTAIRWNHQHRLSGLGPARLPVPVAIRVQQMGDDRLTHSLGGEWGRAGIRVNCTLSWSRSSASASTRVV